MCLTQLLGLYLSYLGVDRRQAVIDRHFADHDAVQQVPHLNADFVGMYAACQRLGVGQDRVDGLVEVLAEALFPRRSGLRSC